MTLLSLCHELNAAMATPRLLQTQELHQWTRSTRQMIEADKQIRVCYDIESTHTSDPIIH